MYERRTPKVIGTLATLIAITTIMTCEFASTATAASSEATLVFGYPNGFSGASNLFGLGAQTTFNGAVVEITPGGVTHQTGNLWYKAQQNIQSFTTDFTFEISASASIPSIACMAFVIQNTNSSTNPLAFGSAASADANVCGYGAYTGLGGNQIPLHSSIAVKFDIANNGSNSFLSGSAPNATGLYINGGPWAALTPINDLNPTGINLNTGHIMDAHLVYDGTLLTMVLKDTVTNTQARYSWPVNIPAVTGSDSAWVGITGGQVSSQTLKVLSWSYWTGFNSRLATPTFSVSPGSYPSAQTVSISAPAGSTIYYSTNGLPPTSSSTRYSGPITVSSSKLIQAVAIGPNLTDSLVASANYQIASSGTPIVNFPSGFAEASGLVIPVGYAKLNGSSLRLTDTNLLGLEAGAAWYAAPLNVTKFSTSFTLQTTGSANGMTFCIQNQTAASSDASSLLVSGGPTAVGQSQSGLGYSGSTGTGGRNSGILNSIAIKFDLYNSPGNTTGLYTNGADLTGTGPQVSINGVNLNSGHPLNVSLNYDGATLAMKITDSVTGATFSHSWPIDIPSIVGGNTAYVGFTGSTGGLFANQNVTSWTYSTGAATTSAAAPPPTPAAPTNLRVQ
jgi:Legume lectin domain/Chitobiase/beta-hexosaminidase C-terminal domain